MPTPTPAKPRTSSQRAQGFGTLLAFAVAVGFAVHLLRTEAPPADAPAIPDERATPATNADARAPSAAAAESRETPSVEQVVQNVARALPRGEREAQRLKLLEVQALVKSGQIGSARARARDYFERWPNGPDIAALEQLTGAHPTGDAPRR